MKDSTLGTLLGKLVDAFHPEAAITVLAAITWPARGPHRPNKGQVVPQLRPPTTAIRSMSDPRNRKPVEGTSKGFTSDW